MPYLDVSHNYLHRFYFADNFVDIVVDFAEIDDKALDLDMVEIVKIVHYEKLVVVVVLGNPRQVGLFIIIIK